MSPGQEYISRALPGGMWLDFLEEGQMERTKFIPGGYELAGRQVVAVADAASSWDCVVVLASLVHRNPPEELLAVATLLITTGVVEVLP